MNNRAISFIRNFSYTITSNLVTVVVSMLVVFIVPKFIGVEDYGYWQLYLFYSSYVGFMHFGWNNGIYLRYGGKEYKELNMRLLFSQFYMLASLQIIIAITILIISSLLLNDQNRIYIIQMTILIMILLNVRYMLIYIFQSTNRIKEYAQIILIDRIFYVLLILTFLVLEIRDYKLLIVADLLGRLISLSYAMFCAKDIVFRKFSTFYFSFCEAKENISVGIKLMIANISSLLIIGIVRFGIERSWSISTFGKVSLSLSVSSLMMIFINALGIILFPILRRVNEEKLPSIYLMMRELLMAVLLGGLILYFPLKGLLSEWLPDYNESLMYMALLFPMCVYEGKMALLINTYFKTLRKEDLMLKINLITLILSFITTSLTILVLKNLDLAVVSIVFLLAIRCMLAELLLSKILNISIFKNIALELIMTLTFILVGWFVQSWHSIYIYALAYVLYLVIKREEIVITTINIKSLIKK